MVSLCGWLAPGLVWAQRADPPPTTAPATPGDAGPETKSPAAQDVAAEVIEVRGAVERSAVPADAAEAQAVKWTPIKTGEKLTAGTQIRTGLRAHLVLRFGDASVVMIKRSTLASIDEFYREANTETVRLGLGYGAVRGGTTAGPVRSDFVVDSTVATLAKRGTEGWEFWVEPYTGRFRVSLAERGLVDALEKFTRQRRGVRPGEYANEANIAAMWIKQDIFDRTVHFFTAESISVADADFDVRNPDGLGVLGPGLGSDVSAFSGRPPGPPPGQGLLGPERRRPLDTLLFKPSFVARPEGNFGVAPTFDILLPTSQRKAVMHSARSRGALRRQLSRWISPPRRR